MSRDALLTDLYQLTMLDAYLRAGMTDSAVFEFFVRKLPASRGFLLAAGLEQVLAYLEELRFDDEDLEYLRRSGYAALADGLASFRFTGDVDAVPEGTVVFENEPILRVVAPLPEGQLVESRIINLVHFETLVASKAARVVLAARGKALLDFGFRRAHGAEAGLLAARASYVAGFAGTATVLAGERFGIPLFGTMAHSFVQAHDDELEALRRFATDHPGTVLLIDTYDTEAAAHKVVQLAREGLAIGGVRIDSGDLAAHARAVRAIFDAAGLRGCRIFASGGLDEAQIQDLVASGAPIDGYGVGTRVDTSADAPYLDCAYKLQEYAGRPRRKKSEGKATWPGRKQVRRKVAPDGRWLGDVVALEDEAADGVPLLVPAMRGGRRVAPAESLDVIRARAAAELARLPPALASLGTTPAYPVAISPGVEDLARAAGA